MIRHSDTDLRGRSPALHRRTWWRTLLAAAAIALGGGGVPAAAQVTGLPPGITQEEAGRLLREQPDLVRQRLRASGLSPDEIRSRLVAAGYSPTMLDAFLGDTVAPGTGVPLGTLQALEALGVPAFQPEGLEPVPLRAGLGVRPALPPSRVFGLDIFRGRTTQFQPVLTGPVPDDYRVGPGDVLVLVLTGEVELTHQLSVTREGFIVIPQVGQLFVNSLTMAQLRDVLTERLGRSYSGIRRGTTQFDVTIARLRTIQVYVVGDVVQPGAYQLASVATVLNALYAAGGLTERGNLRAIRVERAGRTVTTFDLYDYLLAGSTENDVVLEQGDRVFVPLRAARVAVAGAVERAGIYEVERGETLADVVVMAGGFRADAQLERIAIHRILPAGQRPPGPSPRITVDVRLAAPDGAEDLVADSSLTRLVPPFPLVDGDSIEVDEILPPERSLYVTIGGMVNKPGQFPWEAGMTLRDLVLLGRGPRVGADLREAEIARLPANRTDGALAETFRVPLDSSYLFERDALGRYLGPAGIVFPAAGQAPEVQLEPFDHVTIFRQPEFELQRRVTITGEVRFPGPYALEQKDDRLSELVRRAGGLLPTAHPEGARFFRILDDAGRVNIRLPAALAEPGSDEDVVLQPGDSLAVPEYVPFVRVRGAVNSPVSVRYEEGRDFDYYIANAGGFAHNADKGRTSVRYADGTARVRSKFLFFSSYPTPGPGSTIVVPAEPEGRGGVNLSVLFGGIAQILSAVTTIILVVQRL